MVGSRLPLLDRDVAASLAEEHGVPTQLANYNSFRIFLHEPTIARSLANLLKTLLSSSDGALNAKKKELIILRVASETGSHYEWTQHWKLALGLGIPEDMLLAVKNWQQATCFDEIDLILLAATDEMLANGIFSDAIWDACRRVLPTAREQVEFVSVIAMFSALSMLLRAMEVPPETEGARPSAKLDSLFG